MAQAQADRVEAASAGSPISASAPRARSCSGSWPCWPCRSRPSPPRSMPQAHQIGLLNQVAWPAWIKIVVALLVLDLAIWAQHLGLAQDPAVLAAAPGASRRPRHRRDHGGALSPGRDRAVDAVEDRGGGAARRLAVGGVPVRGDPQCLRHVQPRQYRAARVARPGLAAASSSRPTCIGCITRCCGASTIPITASISRSGTGCSAPTRRSRRPGIKA